MTQELILLQAPMTVTRSIPEPTPFVESILDVSGPAASGANFRQSIMPCINSICDMHQAVDDREIDQEFAELLQKHLNIVKKKLDGKLPETEKQGQTIAMLVGVQKGGSKRIYNCKGNHGM